MYLRFKIELDANHQARIFQIAVRIGCAFEQAARRLVESRVRGSFDGCHTTTATGSLAIVVGVEVGAILSVAK